MSKNKIAAQILKAEMLGDEVEAQRLKQELKNLESDGPSREVPSDSRNDRSDHRNKALFKGDSRKRVFPERDAMSNPPSMTARAGPRGKVAKFLQSTNSLSQMFDQEKKLTPTDEARMYLQTAAKFSKEDIETKYFSSEIDNSQEILGREKRRNNTAQSNNSLNVVREEEKRHCGRCIDKIAHHLLIHTMDRVFIALPRVKSYSPTMSNVYISNKDHSDRSFVSSDSRTLIECEQYIEILKSLWKRHGYRCIIMETYLRNRHARKYDTTSCQNHFQIHCLPVKEKHFENARMSFKQALQNCEREWSMNKKVIVTDGRRIQRYLPKGLSYFWVCFDELTNGFAHVIENEGDFSRNFGLEVLASFIDKDFNPMRVEEYRSYQEAFEKSRDFKLMFMECYNSRETSDGSFG